MNVERDGTGFGSGLVGATLVVARVGIVHGFGTGRDKPVPYSARMSHQNAPGPAPPNFWWDKRSLSH